jgi:hypothetical protein
MPIRITNLRFVPVVRRQGDGLASTAGNTRHARNPGMTSPLPKDALRVPLDNWRGHRPTSSHGNARLQERGATARYRASDYRRLWLPKAPPRSFHKQNGDDHAKEDSHRAFNSADCCINGASDRCFGIPPRANQGPGGDKRAASEQQCLCRTRRYCSSVGRVELCRWCDGLGDRRSLICDVLKKGSGIAGALLKLTLCARRRALRFLVLTTCRLRSQCDRFKVSPAACADPNWRSHLYSLAAEGAAALQEPRDVAELASEPQGHGSCRRLPLLSSQLISGRWATRL